jgi:hypothetical protein
MAEFDPPNSRAAPRILQAERGSDFFLVARCEEYGSIYIGSGWQELAPPSVAADAQVSPPAVQRLFVQHGSPRPPHLVAASPCAPTQALAVQVRLPLPSGQTSPAAVQVAPVVVVQQQPPAVQ